MTPVRSALAAPRRQKGFTLIETTITLTLMAISGVAVLALTNSLFLGDQMLRDAQQSNALLQSCLDELVTIRRREGFAATLQCDDLNTLVPGYTLNIDDTVTPEICPSGTDCKQVALTVQHNGNTSQPVTLLLVNATDN